MELAKTCMSDLIKRGQWKVEFFLQKDARVHRSTYEMRAIGEIVEERSFSLDPQEFVDHTFNYIGLEHVQSLTGDLVNFLPTLGKAIRSRSKIFRRGDVLYGRLRPYLNKVFFADDRAAEGICSGEFHVLIPQPNLVRGVILRALLASTYVRDVVSRLQSGSTHPRLALDDLLSINVPVPPIEAQIQLESFIKSEDLRRRTLATNVGMLPERLLTALEEHFEHGTPCRELSLVDYIYTTSSHMLPASHKLQQLSLPMV